MSLRKRFRSALSGRYVTEPVAKADPGGTVAEGAYADVRLEMLGYKAHLTELRAAAWDFHDHPRSRHARARLKQVLEAADDAVARRQ